MLFYMMNKNKTIYDLRKAASYTLDEVSRLSNLEGSFLKKHEMTRLKEIPKMERAQLISVFEKVIGKI